MIWRAVANQLLSSLFEPPCAACSRALARPLDGAVCDACWASVVRATADRHRTRPPGVRFDGGRALDGTAAVGEYDGRLRDIIHALKYDRRRSIAKPLGALMRTAGADLLRNATVVVPVPLHPRRERMRGFNQADDLARALGLPVRPLIRRVRFTTPQIDLPADERHRNVRDAFALAGSKDQRLAFLSAIVVLVDDVSTTGATLDGCARVLKAAGVKEVRALTAARVATGPH